MSQSKVSGWRRISSTILFFLAIPMVFLGLIDPLEGGLALVLALVIYLAAFSLAGHGPIKLLWIPFVSAVGIGAAVLVLAIFGTNRVGEHAPFIPLSIGNWIYRLAVLVALAGAVLTAVKALKSKAS